jgi:hypothetical protein
MSIITIKHENFISLSINLRENCVLYLLRGSMWFSFLRNICSKFTNFKKMTMTIKSTSSKALSNFLPCRSCPLDLTADRRHVLSHLFSATARVHLLILFLFWSAYLRTRWFVKHSKFRFFMVNYMNAICTSFSRGPHICETTMWLHTIVKTDRSVGKKDTGMTFPKTNFPFLRIAEMTGF